MPCSSSTRFHVCAVCSATPTAAATCAQGLPACNIRPARTRLRYASLILTAIAHYLDRFDKDTAQQWLNGCHELRNSQ